MSLSLKHYEILFTNANEIAKLIIFNELLPEIKRYLTEEQLENCLKPSDNESQMRLFCANVIAINSIDMYNILTNHLFIKIKAPLALHRAMSLQSDDGISLLSVTNSEECFDDDKKQINSSLQIQIETAKSTIRELQIALAAMHDMVSVFIGVKEQTQLSTSQLNRLGDLLLEVKSLVELENRKSSNEYLPVVNNQKKIVEEKINKVSSNDDLSSSAYEQVFVNEIQKVFTNHLNEPCESGNKYNEMPRGDVFCDVCRSKNKSLPFKGYRFKCLQCPDFDMCLTCFLNNHHIGHDMIVSRKKGSLGSDLSKCWMKLFYPQTPIRW